MSVYSRDMLTRPLQLYCSMLSNIRHDHFRPDESRTSRMVDLMKIADNPVKTAVQNVPATVQMPPKSGDGASVTGEYEPSSPIETENKWSMADGGSDGSSEIPSTSSSSSDSDEEPEMLPLCRISRVLFGGTSVAMWSTSVRRSNSRRPVEGHFFRHL